ncbi:hypothetical protein Tco_0138202, partial [Tanacetum coccineum]
MASSASSSTKNPPKKVARTSNIDISPNESSSLQENNHITTTLTTTLALSLTLPNASQILAPQPSKPSPLEPREFIFSTPPISPHPYLNSLEDLQTRCSNPPPPPTFEQITNQSTDHMEYEAYLPSLPPTNLNRRGIGCLVVQIAWYPSATKDGTFLQRIQFPFVLLDAL